MIEERDKKISIYEVPLSLVEHRLDELIVEKLNLPAKALDIDDWRGDARSACFNPAHEITIAVVGKYIKHHDAYKSVYESLDHAGIALQSRVVVRKVEAEEVEREGADSILGGVDGILVPGGFGIAASPARSRRSASPARKASRSSASAWACSAPSSSSPATWSAWRTPTAPSSTTTAPIPSSACSTTSTPSPTWAARCGWDCIPVTWRKEAGPKRLTAARSSTNGIGIATSSTTSTASSSRRTA